MQQASPPPKNTKLIFQGGTMANILYIFGLLGRLVMMFSVLINIHVVYLIARSPGVVSWTDYLLDGHGSRLIDVLFVLAFTEVVSCVLIIVVGYYQRLWGLRRNTMVQWYFIFTVLVTMIILNYLSCSQVASAY
jgi:hypothetical protein